MTREEARKRLRGILTEAVEFENSVCYVTEEDREPLEMAIKALEQEPIDYKTQYESFVKKAEIVISQLRADRDKLADVFDKIRAEIDRIEINRQIDEYTAFIRSGNEVKKIALDIIDKYKAESEDKE